MWDTIYRQCTYIQRTYNPTQQTKSLIEKCIWMRQKNKKNETCQQVWIWPVKVGDQNCASWVVLTSSWSIQPHPTPTHELHCSLGSHPLFFHCLYPFLPPNPHLPPHLSPPSPSCILKWRPLAHPSSSCSSHEALPWPWTPWIHCQSDYVRLATPSHLTPAVCQYLHVSLCLSLSICFVKTE